jgi:hypothetical protein
VWRLDFKVGLSPNGSKYSIHAGVKVVGSQGPKDIIEDSQDSIQKLHKQKAASMNNAVRQNFTSNGLFENIPFCNK